eukprot:m.286959 g.286959  ORF g.286959 m.286959 type:complete len:111 (-) comp15786_c0_seq1:609-941(-)
MTKDSAHAQQANCLTAPKTLAKWFGYVVFILFTTAFLWLAGGYVWFISEDPTEIEIARGVCIAGIAIGGLLLLIVTFAYLSKCGGYRKRIKREKKEAAEAEAARLAEENL